MPSRYLPLWLFVSLQWNHFTCSNSGGMFYRIENFLAFPGLSNFSYDYMEILIFLPACRMDVMGLTFERFRGQQPLPKWIAVVNGLKTPVLRSFRQCDKLLWIVSEKRFCMVWNIRWSQYTDALFNDACGRYVLRKIQT